MAELWKSIQIYILQPTNLPGVTEKTLCYVASPKFVQTCVSHIYSQLGLHHEMY